MFVLIVIVCDDLDSCLVGLDGGVDDYIIKFFDLFELFVCICVVLCC